MTRPIVPSPTRAFLEAPGFYPPCRLWFYGNIRLLHGDLAYIPSTFGDWCPIPSDLDRIEREAEEIVLNGSILVCGVHNLAHRRAAIVPLRWASPRILVFSGGFRFHLGKDLQSEPFQAAQLWRYQWDPKTDLAVSLRHPSSKPTYAYHNPTVDRLVAELAEGRRQGLCGISNPFPDVLRE